MPFELLTLDRQVLVSKLLFAVIATLSSIMEKDSEPGMFLNYVTQFQALSEKETSWEQR